MTKTIWDKSYKLSLMKLFLNFFISEWRNLKSENAVKLNSVFQWDFHIIRPEFL